MNQRTNRRKFLKTTTAVGAGYWVAGGVAPKQSIAANEQIAFAAVGVGGKGTSDSNDASRNGDMVAICDIDETTLGNAAKRFPKAKKFFDYRKMLDEMAKSIDAVTVSTPDHSHAPASLRAMRQGMHCFTQKPLTHTIYEARLMGEVAREKGLATMMGNQGTANSGLRHAATLVQNGEIGEVKEAHVWTNRPVWPSGLKRPTDTPPIPSSVHWNEFLGPARERPYHPSYHPFKWRGWWDFGTGALGDMACHTLNMPFAALELRDPISVVAESPGHNGETYAGWSIITFEYAATENRGPITLKWYDGLKLPPEELRSGATLRPGEGSSDTGALLVGSKATLYSPGDYAAEFEIIGVEEPPEAEYEESPGHFNEWVRAIKGGAPAMSNFPDYAGPLSETILLGNLAVWAARGEDATGESDGDVVVGKKIEWDAKNLVATNAPEVMPIVNKEYRDGYGIEG